MMHDHVIWIDSAYWFYTWLWLSILLLVPTWFHKAGPADRMANGFGAAFGGVLLMIAALSILQFFGIEFGMRG